MMSVFQIILLVVVALILVGLFAYLIRIVPQAKAYVVERLGAYHLHLHRRRGRRQLRRRQECTLRFSIL